MKKLVQLSQEPQVLESEFGKLNGLTTSTDNFYVRNHFPIPPIDASSWHLSLEGSVRCPCRFSYADLLAQPQAALSVTLECAGNNRSFLPDRVEGVQWQLGGAGTAEWTGVRLADLLQIADCKEQAKEVILCGADCGIVEDGPAPRSPIHYARSLPLEKAMEGDVLLAIAMNGEPLTREHGFPVRAIVPGWYACSSIKWLERIIVSDNQFQGYFQTIDYAYWQAEHGEAVRVPITSVQVKAQIAHPAPGEIVAAGSSYLVQGAAWSGAGAIAAVQITTDEGESWHDCELVGERLPNAWRLWQYRWMVPNTSGAAVLKARARDIKGNVQPLEHDVNKGGYMINFCLPISVTVA